MVSTKPPFEAPLISILLRKFYSKNPQEITYCNRTSFFYVVFTFDITNYELSRSVPLKVMIIGVVGSASAWNGKIQL